MKNSILKIGQVILCICLIALCFSFNAQTNFQWAKQMGGNGQGGGDRGYAIATDAFGNVYTTGILSGVCDFDPGPGTYTLSSAAGISTPNIFISKLDASGNFVWAKQIAGAGMGRGYGIALDASGNVLITGSFQNTADFDPSASTFNLTSAGSNDIFILKLNASGNFVWAKNLGGSADDIGYGIKADASGNVYSTGYFQGIADFDPSAATYTLSVFGSNASAFVSKLDANGNFIWAKQFNGTTGNPGVVANSIALDASGNIYTGGNFSGQVDFDPGASTFTIQAINSDIFISKLDPSGNFIWAKNVGGPSVSSTALSIAMDASNNVYATGYFDNTTDFDPGAGTFPLTSFGGGDIYVLKLNSSGNFVWAKQMGGTAASEQGKSITVSAAGDIYTTGYYGINADFDPGVGTYTLTTPGGQAVFVSKLDASGNFVLANGFGLGNSSGNGIVVDAYSDIYTVGNFDTNIDFDPTAGTFTLAPIGNYSDVFVQKLGQSVCPTFSINSSTSSYTLMCALNSLTLNAVSNTSLSGVTFTWTAPSSATTSGSSYTCTAAGIYTISATATSNTCVVTQTLGIIQTTGNVAFNVSANGSTCNNNGTATVNITSGTAPYTYSWSTTGTFSAVTGLAPGNYSVTVTDANSCNATNTFVINNIAPSFSSVPICYVTVDSLSQHNVITWDKTAFASADSFFIYREIGTNIYKKIQSQPYSAFSQFVDTVKTLYFPNTGDPNVGTYRYKMKTLDNCVNYSTFSPYHNTLFLINSNGTFSWSQLYQIEGDPNPVSAYVLERDDLSNGNWHAIGSVSGTQQFIIDPAYSSYQLTASWRVKTQWNINCTPTVRTSAISSVSYSNRITNNTLGIKQNTIEDLLNVYPNPANSILNFVIKNNQINSGVYELTLLNAVGQKIYSTSGTIFNSVSIDMSAYPNGLYFANFTNNNKVYTGKIIVSK